MPGSSSFEAIEASARETDPAVIAEAADRAAIALVRGARDQADEALVSRVVHLADTEGLETLADLWAGAPPESLAGVLWRLYVLREWVRRAPDEASLDYSAGVRFADVDHAVAGAAAPKICANSASSASVVASSSERPTV